MALYSDLTLDYWAQVLTHFEQPGPRFSKAPRHITTSNSSVQHTERFPWYGHHFFKRRIHNTFSDRSHLLASSPAILGKVVYQLANDLVFLADTERFTSIVLTAALESLWCTV